MPRHFPYEFVIENIAGIYELWPLPLPYDMIYLECIINYSMSICLFLCTLDGKHQNLLHFYTDLPQNYLGISKSVFISLSSIVKQYHQQPLQMAFCDLMHTF